LSNVKLVRSGVLAAESNTINEKRTKALAKSIVEISFIKPPQGHEGWVLANARDVPDEILRTREETSDKIQIKRNPRRMRRFYALGILHFNGVVSRGSIV
jgi:hypothetical protein